MSGLGAMYDTVKAELDEANAKIKKLEEEKANDLKQTDELVKVMTNKTPCIDQLQEDWERACDGDNISGVVKAGEEFIERLVEIRDLEYRVTEVGYVENKYLREEADRLQLHVDDYNKALPEIKALRDYIKSLCQCDRSYRYLKDDGNTCPHCKALKKDEAEND